MKCQPCMLIRPVQCRTVLFHSSFIEDCHLSLGNSLSNMFFSQPGLLGFENWRKQFARKPPCSWWIHVNPYFIVEYRTSIPLPISSTNPWVPAASQAPGHPTVRSWRLATRRSRECRQISGADAGAWEWHLGTQRGRNRHHSSPIAQKCEKMVGLQGEVMALDDT